MNTPSILGFVCILAIGIVGHCLPRFTRPDLYFGVTVDPAFRNTDEGRRILRNYRLVLWCSIITAGALILALHRPVAAFILYVIGMCGAQVASHRSALIHAAPRSATIEVDLSAPRENIPGGLLTALLPLIALLGIGLWAVPHMAQLPSRLPVHWGFDGPNRWVMTSSPAIIVLLVQHAFVCLVLIASAFGVLHWSRRISVASAASERRFRRRTVVLILTVEYMMILPPIFILLQAPAVAMQVWIVTLSITVLAFITGLMLTGQGGARQNTPSERPSGDGTADARWIGGFIYFNPTDPALLVERRTGIGWTLNFGNPWSWVPLIAVAVIVVIGPLLVQGAFSSAVTMPLQADDRGTPLNSRPPSPGTEDSIRRYILSLEQGHPNYEAMSPQLAASVNRQLPKLLALIEALGEFKSLTYEGADSDGADVYLATFARGQLQWHIGPLVDGKVTYRRVHEIGALAGEARTAHGSGMFHCVGQVWNKKRGNLVKELLG